MPTIISPCGGASCASLIDSTATAGAVCGVHSVGAAAGLVLTSDGASGSLWQAASAAPGSYATRVLAEASLVGYWPLDDAAVPAHDAGPLNRPLTNLTVLPVTFAQPGPFTDSTATSVAFNGYFGSNTNLSNALYDANAFAAPYPYAFANVATYTLEALIYLTAAQNGALLQVWDGASGSAGGLLLGVENNVLAARRAGGVLTSGIVLPLNRWTHCAVTYDGATLRLYVNGTLVASGASAGNHSAAGTLVLGRSWQPTGTGDVNTLQGQLAQAAIYNTALSAATIAAHAASGIASSASFGTVRSVTAAFTLTPADNYLLASGTFTVTLPTAAGISGRLYTVKNTGAGTVTLSAAGTEKIDGAGAPGTYALTVSQSAIVVVSDGAGWQIVGKYL